MPFEEEARLQKNIHFNETLGVLELYAPRTASAISPGQFVHMKLNAFDQHILRRPFSIYYTQKDLGIIAILYQVVGKGTAFLRNAQPGDVFSILAPLGNTWPKSFGKSLLVGGGVGAAPLYMLAQTLSETSCDFEVVLGARNADALVTKDAYEQLGMPLHIATDDGSVGLKGFATLPVEKLLQEQDFSTIYCCGPEPFMKAIAQLAHTYKTNCYISTEKRMACGIGACLSCVVDLPQGKVRSCIDGPIFNTQEISL